MGEGDKGDACPLKKVSRHKLRGSTNCSIIVQNMPKIKNAVKFGNICYSYVKFGGRVDEVDEKGMKNTKKSERALE